ncbi:MAG TPA: AAA family ATPase [Propionibacteriaceae bacterium]
MPDHLAVVLSGRPCLDVIGMGQPWPVPVGWWDRAHRRVQELVEDPRAGATQIWTSWPEGTRDVAPFLQNLAMSLGGHVAIFAGDFPQFPEQIVDPYLSDDQRRPALPARNWYLTDSEWPLFLLRYAGEDPTSRRGALELSRDCVAFFSEVGPLARRGRVLLNIYTRVLDDLELAEFHLHASYPEIARLWRHLLLTPREQAVLPEIAGWGAALAWSYEGLRAAHVHLSSVTLRAETLPEVIASMALTDQVETLPAGLAVAVGSDCFDEISTAFEQRRPGFDGAEWLQYNRGWLARGLLAGEIDACRSWLAMAAQVSRLVTGLPGPPRPSAAPDTIGFVADVEELYSVRRGTNPLVRHFTDDDPGPTGGNRGPTPPPAAPPLEVQEDESVDEVPQAEKVPPVEIGDPEAELAALVGLEPVKEQVRRLVAEAQADKLRQSAGMPESERSRHLVFAGNPGTGKTTVARLLARTYAQLGLLAHGHLVEAGPMDLVGQHAGHTEPRVLRLFDRASGGVLFIHEAHALVPEDPAGDFGSEAVTTLLELMDDRRDEVVVVAAGDPVLMQHFLAAHPGLAAHFPRTLTYEDYTDDELYAIFGLAASQQGFLLGEGVEAAVRTLLPTPRPPAFGNGRFVRTLLEEAVSIQAQRIVLLDRPTPDDIRTLQVGDLPGRAPGQATGSTISPGSLTVTRRDRISSA